MTQISKSECIIASSLFLGILLTVYLLYFVVVSMETVRCFAFEKNNNNCLIDNNINLYLFK